MNQFSPPGFTNSTIMHVILSAPNPSDAARFIGQILSIIISIILDRTTSLPLGSSPLTFGEPDDYYFCPAANEGLLVGELMLFLP
jgi:hypothetical protein